MPDSNIELKTYEVGGNQFAVHFTKTQENSVDYEVYRVTIHEDKTIEYIRNDDGTECEFEHGDIEHPFDGNLTSRGIWEGRRQLFRGPGYRSDRANSRAARRSWN